jgi:hypothetical protein
VKGGISRVSLLERTWSHKLSILPLSTTRREAERKIYTAVLYD